MQNSKIIRESLQWYLSQPQDVQLELFNKFGDMAKLLVNHHMEEELKEKSGERYSHDKPSEGKYSRWGVNPGSIIVGEERVRLDVPRIRNNETGETENVGVYKKFREIKRPGEDILMRVILGLSQNNYSQVCQMLYDSFGLSQSSISREMLEESSRVLKEFEERDLSCYEFVGLLIDGKYLSGENIVICLGITSYGVKIPLGFVQTTTENSEAIKGLLSNLIERGLDISGGLLCVIDGSKGIRKAIEEKLGEYGLIQRCQWHKRENVVRYLPEKEKEYYRAKIQSAYLEPDYENAKGMLLSIRDELAKINLTSANSIEEGLEETLTLHRLGLVVEFGSSFSTTNCIESMNSQLSHILRRVTYWRGGDMRARWVASALKQIEKRMRRVNNYSNLNLLKIKLKENINVRNKSVA